MPNKTYAKEWLELSEHNLKAAEILINADHFTDVIGVELQQSIEKCLKSVLAFYGKKIPRTHDLIILSREVKDLIDISEEMLDDFDLATTYFTDQRYPVAKGALPGKDEIEKVFDTATFLYEKAQSIID